MSDRINQNESVSQCSYVDHNHSAICFDPSCLTFRKCPADGFCLLHAVRIGFNHLSGYSMTNNDIISMIESLSLEKLMTYANFSISCISTFKKEMYEYLRCGNYSSSYGDIVPKIIADCLKVNLHIIVYADNRSSSSIIVRGENACVDLYLRKTNDHYDCLLPKLLCTRNTNCYMFNPSSIPTHDQQVESKSACMTYSVGELKLYFRNVCGLTQEYLHDDIEGKVLKQHDIIMFAESFSDPNDEFYLEGFFPRNYARKYRHVNAKRGSGGLYIFIRESILDGVEILHNVDDIIAFLRLDARYFGLEKDIYLANCYIVPESSVYHNSPFAVLNDELTKIPLSAEKIICMDGNAITNCECDIDMEIDGSDGDLGHLLKETTCVQIDPGLIERFSQDKRPLNENGRELIKTCKSSNMMILNSRFGKDKGIGKFTRMCDQKQEYGVLDYMISSPGIFPLINDFSVGTKIPESDHLSLELSLKVNINPIKKKESMHSDWDPSFKYIWKKDDLPMLNEKLNDSLSSKYLELVKDSMINMESVESVTANFDKYIKQACNRSFKTKSPRKRSKLHKRPKLKWWDKECLVKRKQAIQAGAHVLSIHDKAKLAEACRSYRSVTQRKKRKAKKENLDKLSNAFKSNPSGIWDVLNEISGNGSSNSNCPDKDDLFNHFTNLSKPSNDNSFNMEYLEKAKLFMERHLNNQLPRESDLSNEIELEILNANFTKDEIFNAIESLKRNKSPGSDHIPGDFVKQCKDSLVDILCDIHNYRISNKTFPDKWAEGIRSAVFKNGAKKDPNNYRGITILPIFEKIFEIVIYNRLEFLNEAFCKIDESNGGFMKERRTSDNIFILNGLIKKQLLRGKRLYVCFVDFSKAFDRVNRLIMFYKLIRGGWSGRVIDTLQDLYKKTHSRLKVDGHLSKFIYDTVGVNQGGNASGLLFRKYMSDLSDYLHFEFGVIAGDLILAHLLWADDLVLMSDSLSGIKKQLDGLQRFCSDNHMIINELKTKIMCFGSNETIDIEFNGCKIEQVMKYKYVGCIIQSINSVRSDVFVLNYEYLCDKARKALFAAKSKLKHYSTVPCSILCNIFNTLVRPILTYASDVWGVSVKGREKMDRFFLWFLKNMLGIKQSTPSIMVLGETGQILPSIDCVSNVIKFVNRLEFMSDDTFVKQVYNELRQLHHVGFNTWFSKASELVKQNNIILNPNLKIFKGYVKKSLRDEFIMKWQASVMDHINHPKCRFYAKFKFQFRMEPYLDLIDNYHLRKSLARFRTSSHALNIETVRYKKKELTINQYEYQLLCPYCLETENESHFLLSCLRYSNLRQELFELPFFNNTSFLNACSDDKIMYILNVTDKYHLNNLAKFVQNAFLLHSDRVEL